VQLLNRLGYEVVIPAHVESGRAHFSKGLIRDAQKFAIRNVELLKDVVSAQTPLIGLEPSCILSFRDEYPDLVPDRLLDAAKALAKNALRSTSSSPARPTPAGSPGPPSRRSPAPSSSTATATRRRFRRSCRP
jgi:hypothetical protein